MTIKITPQIAMAAGMDAANKNMRKDGRKEWNEEDYNIAAKIAADIFLWIDERSEDANRTI